MLKRVNKEQICCPVVFFEEIWGGKYPAGPRASCYSLVRYQDVVNAVPSANMESELHVQILGFCCEPQKIGTRIGPGRSQIVRLTISSVSSATFNIWCVDWKPFCSGVSNLMRRNLWFFEHQTSRLTFLHEGATFVSLKRLGECKFRIIISNVSLRIHRDLRL